MWVHICMCALHGQALCQLEATTLEELFLSLADGEEAGSLEMFSFCINLRAVLSGHRGPFPLAQESHGVAGGMAGLLGVMRWNSYGSRGLPAMSICRNSCTGCSTKLPFWRDGKGFSTSKAMHSQLNCTLTCHLNLKPWSKGFSIDKMPATKGYWKHDFWAALSICMVFARLHGKETATSSTSSPPRGLDEQVGDRIQITLLHHHGSDSVTH